MESRKANRARLNSVNIGQRSQYNRANTLAWRRKWVQQTSVNAGRLSKVTSLTSSGCFSSLICMLGQPRTVRQSILMHAVRAGARFVIVTPADDSNSLV